MRFVSYRSPSSGRVVPGVIEDRTIYGDPESTATLLDLVRENSDLVTEGARLRRSATESVAFDNADVHAPIAVPPTFRDFMAFEEHVVTCKQKTGRTMSPVWYEQPVFYFSNPYSIRGPHEEIPVPPGCSMFDLELEVAAVIGTEGSDVTQEGAEKHIAGYMVLCDWSARDLQMKETEVGLGPVKGKDSRTTLGPWLVTPDELENARTPRGFDLAMTARINGGTLCQGNWSTMYWSFAEMIAHASRGTKIMPGDIFGSGTVGGGCLLEHIGADADSPEWLGPGDVVELEIERLGLIKTRVSG